MSRIVNKLLSTTGSVVETDEFFNQTTLLLHGDGTNGSQNNTFLDSSSNNFTITRNGNTTQGSYSPYGDRWSNYFDGTGDLLTVADNAALEGGSVDFTLEGWIYPTSSTADVYSNLTLFGKYDTGANSRSYTIGTDSNGNLVIALSNTGSFQSAYLHVSSTTVYSILNEWSHLRLCRVGTTAYLFLNGSLITSGAAPTTVYNGSGFFGIGGASTSATFTGYISDVRFIKGTALSTSSFTPPTEPLTAVSGTSLLTCQSNRFKDNSSNDFAITVNGDTKVTPFSPYAPSAAYDPATGGGSGYFDGTGGSGTNTDRLDVAHNIALSPEGQDFTMECWVYLTASPTVGNRIFDKFNDASREYILFTASTTGNLGFSISPNGSTVNNILSASPLQLNSWTHIAITRNGNLFTLWVNGVSSDTATDSSSIHSGTSDLLIGNRSNNDRTFPGYISDLRIVKGTALYTSNFTPPTAPLTAVTNTSLLCNFINAGIFDSTGKNVLETVGNAQIDTAVTKFGTGSMEFDGTGDLLSMPQSSQTQFGDGDFTIEGWFYRNNTNDGTIYGDRVVFNGLLIGFRNSYVFILASVNGSSWGLNTYASVAGDTVSATTWTHIAIVRSGSTWSAYINGTESYNRTLSGTVVQAGSDVLIGADPADAVPTFNGYIDDLRITKGVARYTANFTPPTKAFPDQ